MSKNLCNKMRKPGNGYEVWQTPDGSWTWEVLKKYQSPENEAKNQFARWLVNVKSPYVESEIGDTYVVDIIKYAVKISSNY